MDAGWVWAVIGVILIIAEILFTTFFLIFVGAGAIIVAVTTGLGWTTGLASQLIVFAASSILMTAVLRRTAKQLLGRGQDTMPGAAGERVKVIVAIPPRDEGAVMYRGSRWIAVSDETAEIPEGSTVEIVAIEGIKIRVKRPE